MQKYEECPKAYEFRYLIKPEVTEDDADHLKIGRAVHAGFEEAYKVFKARGLSGSLIAVECEAIDKLRSEWIDAGLEDHQAQLEAAEAAVRRTLLTRSSHHENIIGIEVEFDLPTPAGYNFIGYADLVEKVGPDAVEILDWKITYKPKDTDEVFRSFQLNNYAWAVREMWPWAKTVWAGENYPMVDQAVRVQLVDEHIEFAAARLDADIEAVLAETEWPTRTGYQCKWCSYRNLCPAMADLPDDQLDW